MTAGLGAVAASLMAALWLAIWRRPEWFIRRPGVVLGVVAAISLAAAIALVEPTKDGPALTMRLDPSEEPMLEPGDPARAVYAESVRNFGDDDVLVAVVTVENVFESSLLGDMRAAGDAIRRLGGVRRVESLVETVDFAYNAAEDMIEIARLIDQIPEETSELTALRERTLTHPWYPKTLVAPGARAASLNVTFAPMSDGEFVERGLDDAIRTRLAPLEGPGRSVYVTGRKHVKAEAHALMTRDLLRLIPLAVLVAAAIALVVTRSLVHAIVPVCASLVATLWAYGLLAALGRPLNLITLILGPMLICVGGVYGVHVLARFEALAADGRSRHAAALACVRYATLPVSIAGATTAAGFASLALSSTPAVAELGLFAAIGVAAVSVLSLTAVPALLSILRRRAGREYFAPPLDWILSVLARISGRRPGTVLAIWAMMCAAAAASLPNIVVDTDYLTFFDERSRVRTDFAAIGEHLVGAMPIYVELDGGAPGAFRDPATLSAVERVARHIEAVEGVDAAISVADIVKRVNRVMEQGDPQAERIPDTRGEITEALFLVPKSDLRRYANANHSRVNVLVRTGLTGSAAVSRLEHDLYEAIETAGLPAGIEARVTGNTIVVNRGADAIAGNQTRTVAVATLVIFILVALSFRSLPTGALAMIPNVVPVLVFFGALGAGLATLSLPTSLIGCVALGIAVDDTAHFLVGYRSRRARGLDETAAARDCTLVLGRPIVMTSLMLVGGFSVLGFSEFATLREFGFLSAATMVVCLTADLTLLPALLIRARA